jgi:hypothetical protein
MGRLILPLKWPRPFAFPGGNPGFDPSHVASQNIIYSAVASGGGFVSLLTGAPATKVGSPVPAITRVIGPNIVPPTAADYFTSPNTGPSGTPAEITMAGIFTCPDLTTRAIFTDGIASCDTLASFSGDFTYIIPGFDLRAGSTVGIPTLVANVPYFFAVSSKTGGNCNIVVRRLDTGQVWGGSQSTMGQSAPGTFGIGGSTGLTTGGASVATVQYSRKALSLQDLRQWANDPWSFWYQ